MSRFYNYHIYNTVFFKSIKLLRNRIVIFVNDGSNAVLRKLGFNIEKEGAFKKVELILFTKIILIELMYNK
ncbi:hypothetical protein H8S20_17620 [Clostridium sp. NSJ-6]|uniref:Uncharacterized protein n=1 Tax=Clostridium hominis TaxID=2763036 RepID=A0ABR7DGZ0_9CLOT|nr:hypothetical protein [Clostridium hominis]MBC5630675.1 hypothetical protein [Clostridium hominis]MDU2670456.1 hypothetical protein [Clostridium sp.]